MKQQISSETISTVVAILFLLAVPGGFYYLDSVRASVPPVPPAPSTIDLTVIRTDLTKEPDSENIFVRTASLELPNVSTAEQAQVTYSLSELGKSNLTKVGQ